MKAAVAALLLLVGSTTAFNPSECDVFIFRSYDNSLWDCGGDLPQKKYCDHSFGEEDADGVGVDVAAHPSRWLDDWCDFMISSVRKTNNDNEFYPLTPEISLTDTPGPSSLEFSAIKDWGCYVVGEDGKTDHSWLVGEGQHAKDVVDECQIKNNLRYFSRDVKNMFKNTLNGILEGHWTDLSYVPEPNAWGFCHYNDNEVSQHYPQNPQVEYAECKPGYHCEHQYIDFALCMPDPHTDHECCISWYNMCNTNNEGGFVEGECCAGSAPDEWGMCNPHLDMEYPPDPPGIDGCQSRIQKTGKSRLSRCFESAPLDSEAIQGDCADGYLCTAHDLYFSTCQTDVSVKNECCEYHFESASNPRPGDCCVGWMSHCHDFDVDGKCIDSQCLPGRETGSEGGQSFLDVHDRICTEPPLVASYRETLGQCIGAHCGVWGDPHIVTCDELHYDCQAVGIFTVMQNHMFNVQANFIEIEGPFGTMSITNDVAFDWVRDEMDDCGEKNMIDCDVSYPTIQFSFPDFLPFDEDTFVPDPFALVVNACPVLFYVDDVLVDISGVEVNGNIYGSEGDNLYIKRNSTDMMLVTYKIGDYYSTVVVYAQGNDPWKGWSCMLSYFICLPTEEQDEFKTSSKGLLGVPDGITTNDWMAPDGQTLVIPDHHREEASFNYCFENWCVSEDDNILQFAEGYGFANYTCPEDEVFVEFDVYTCENPEEIIATCESSPQPIACQIESCIGNPDVDEQIDTVDNITELDTDDTGKNLLEFPEEEEYGDCTNLGYCLSASCGIGAWSGEYPDYNCQGEVEAWSMGFDDGPSVLVGGNFNCLNGIGFEGRGVFLGDMNLEFDACTYLGVTTHGSLIHPFENSNCVEVGGSVDIDTTYNTPKHIYYDQTNTDRACHFIYGDGCTLNGEACPTTQTELGEQYVNTNGDFKQDSFMDLQKWEDEITLLKQKTDYWDSLEANGVTSFITGGTILKFEPGQDNNSVQIFEIDMIGEEVMNLIFKKQLHGKTIMIKVNGDGEFHVPKFCFKEEDALPGTEMICGRNGFDPGLTTSIVWLFNTSNEVILTGDSQLMGSLVIPYGSLTLKNTGQSGRLIVGGDLTFDGPVELHNYEFDPQTKPLPLPDDLDAICTVTPPVCEETYKVLTSETACPAKPEGIVKLIKSSGDYPEGEPILYDFILDQPEDGSAHTVKFKVDNPFTNFTDIFIKHVKKVGKYALDPVCDKMPFTAGCNFDAPVIEVGCHEYDGIDPFALVNIYFASDTDEFVLDAGSDDVTIDKCCKPPAEYQAGYGVIEYTFEIQCVCPPDEAAQSS